MQDLSSPTRNGTHALCSGSMEFLPLDHQQVPDVGYYYSKSKVKNTVSLYQNSKPKQYPERLQRLVVPQRTERHTGPSISLLSLPKQKIN